MGKSATTKDAQDIYLPPSGRFCLQDLLICSCCCVYKNVDHKTVVAIPSWNNLYIIQYQAMPTFTFKYTGPEDVISFCSCLGELTVDIFLLCCCCTGSSSESLSHSPGLQHPEGLISTFHQICLQNNIYSSLDISKE